MFVAVCVVSVVWLYGLWFDVVRRVCCGVCAFVVV